MNISLVTEFYKVLSNRTKASIQNRPWTENQEKIFKASKLMKYGPNFYFGQDFA